MSRLILAEQASAPSTPAAGKVAIYVDTTATPLLKMVDDNGTVTTLLSSGTAATKALDNLASVAINTDLLLGSSDGGALGSATKMWSDLFLAAGAVINFNNGNVTLTHSAGVLTLGGTSTLALGTNSLTLTGSIAATGARVTKGWFTDVESTNMPTVGGTSLSSTFAAIAQTFYIGTTQVAINRSSAALTLAGITLTTPDIGTPSAGVLTNCTGLPAASIVAGTLPAGTYLLAENASIGLDPAGSADGKYSGITITGVAGYAQTYGDLVYLAVADSRWEKTDADAAATAAGVLIGIVVVAGAADGNACTILLQGQIRADAAFPALTVGAAVYVGETAGAIQVAIPTGADNIVRVVGFALTADEIYFNPSQDSGVTVA